MTATQRAQLPQGRVGRLIYDTGDQVYEFGTDKILKLARARTKEHAKREVARFQAIKRKDSPHVVRIHAAGIAGPYVYQVLDRMTEARPTPRQVMALYEAIQRDGLIHYDAQPQNVMRDSAGRLRFIDIDGIQMVATGNPSGVAGTLATVNFVDNPPWVGQVLADTLKTVQATVRPEWLPALDSVRRGRGGSMVSKVKEYGCGVYGCVIPTLDPGIVLKLTTDDTEAEFAANVADTLVAPICVGYHMILETKVKHQGRTVYLLWRDSAEQVGKIREEPNGDWAVHFIAKQHAAAQVAFRALHAAGMTPETDRLLVLWAESCEAMARQTNFPDLRELGEGLVEVWGQQSIFFGDIHDGNLGKVNDRWVITDPGNIAVVDRSLVKNPPRGPRRNPGGQELAAKINAAARLVATGPGRSSAYIADVWKQFERDGAAGSASYDEFRCELINLFRDGSVVLEPAKDKRTAAAKASALTIGATVFHAVTVAQAAPASRTAAPVPAASKKAVSDIEFARTVNEVASDTDADIRFGDRKIFISDIWDVVSADPDYDAMGEREFKRRLVAAHQAKRVVLARADLVSAMDPAIVRASETIANGAVFHFVIDPKIGNQVGRPVPAPPPAPVRAAPAGQPLDIIGAVKEAVRDAPASDRFGPDKVFVSEVWATISEDPNIRPMGIVAFKRWLIGANRDGRLALARADLIGAMNRAQVDESEIEDRGSTFHFIIDPNA